LYGSKTRGPEDDSVESKHVALISHYMFNIITVVFDGPSPPFTTHVYCALKRYMYVPARRVKTKCLTKYL